MAQRKREKRIFLTAWDIPPPVPTMFDSRIGDVIEELHKGNLVPLAEEIENGRLDYVTRFLKPGENTRIARALRTGSPLTQAEKRRNRGAEKERDATLLAQTCYWKAVGLPLFSQTSSKTAIHQAALDYGTSPLSGAPARTAESVYKYVWAPLQKTKNPLMGNTLEKPLLSFLMGLSDAAVDVTDATRRFIWFGDRLLSNSAAVFLEYEKKAELAALTDQSNHVCKKYLDKIGTKKRKRTYLKS